MKKKQPSLEKMVKYIVWTENKVRDDLECMLYDVAT